MSSRKIYPWDDSRIVLICGAGGAGKTTLSAAIALDYAARGYKTIVLTIDPAKRLAQALGLSGISHIPQQIDIGRRGNGSLTAMMLNTKRMFDRIVEKYSTDDRVKETVLKHPLYNHLSNMLAGSQEYMAMENLYQIATDYDFERIVVDTPPSKHALDFLDAPQKMVNAITNSVLKLLIRPYQWAGKRGGRLMGVFGRITGAQFLQEVADFLASTVTLLDGFRERAADVMSLINSDSLRLVLVTRPTHSMITDSSEFIRSVEIRGLKPSGCIVNGLLPRISKKVADIKQCAEWCEKQEDKNLHQVSKHLAWMERSYMTEDQLLKDLDRLNPNIPVYTLALCISPVHDIKSLASLYSRIDAL